MYINNNLVSFFVILFNILSISFGYSNSCEGCNELCQDERWNIIKGNWNEGVDCMLSNTNSDAGNIVWFGSANGNDADECHYDFEDFIIEVEYEINSNSGDAGIIFRANKVSTINDGGQQYYIGLYPEADKVIFGRMNNGWTPLHIASYTINPNTKYKLKIVGIGSNYKVFIDNNLVLDNIEQNEYLSGSIGLRTFYAPSKYYSLTIKNANKLCNCNDWNIIKGNWYQDKDCSLINTNTDSGNVLWFGKQNGLIPDYKYDFTSFILEIEYEINSNSGDSGIMFRANTASTINDGGQQYYIGIYPALDKVVFGKMDNGWNALHTASYVIIPNTIYTLKVVADGSQYNIYIDNNLILSNIERGEYLAGSIGLRTYNAPSKYHSLFITSKN